MLGRWQTDRKGERDIWFLPVARIDTTRPKGVVPYSVRLIAGLLRYRARIPRPRIVQAHRVDVGLATRLLFRGPLVYCIHTQERGLLGPTSDSFWRFPASLHERLDRTIVAAGRAGDRVQPGLRGEGAAVEPAHRRPRPPGSTPRSPVPAPDPHPHARGLGGPAGGPEGPRAGRPGVRRASRESDPDEPWTLEMIGSGHAAAGAEAQIAALPPDVAPPDHAARPARRRRTSPRHAAAPVCS